jgi:hypothetical protein
MGEASGDKRATEEFQRVTNGKLSEKHKNTTCRASNCKVSKTQNSLINKFRIKILIPSRILNVCQNGTLTPLKQNGLLCEN